MLRKKLWTAIVSIMLLMCMTVSSALAVDVTLMEQPEDSDISRYANEMTTVGDTLYMVVNETDQPTALYQWKNGMTDVEKVIDCIQYSSYVSSMEELQSQAENIKEQYDKTVDPNYAVAQMTAYGDKLLGINLVNGKVFTIAAKDNTAVYEDVVTLKTTEAFFQTDGEGEEAYRYPAECGGMVTAGDKLLYLSRGWDNMTGKQFFKLLTADLKTGEVTEAKVQNAQVLTAYKDGKALLVCRDPEKEYDPEAEKWNNAEVYVYDPATDAAAKTGEIEMNDIRPMTYSAHLDGLVWIENCRVMGTKDFKTAAQYGYVPTDYADRLITVGDSVVVGNGSYGVYIRTLTENFNADESLTVYGSYMDRGTMLFTKKYPQIPVYGSEEYYDSAEKLSQAMVSGDNSIDVLEMEVGYSSFTRLMNKGYCADLSGDAELMAYAERLYPAFKDAVMKDGKLYAIPVRGYSYNGWYVATGVMEEMGLTYDDIPKNFVDLCAFANKWNNEWVEEYPQFTLIEYTENYKEALFRYMVEGYLNYCTAKKQEVRFNSPEFRAMLEALETLKVENLERGAQDANEDEVGYRQGLLMPYYSVVGNFSDDSEYRQFVPMTLTADTDYVTGVLLSVLFVNPKTEHMESAVNLLKCKLESLRDSERHVLFMDETEPVLNKDYDRMVESEQKYIDNLKKSLEEADEADKKEIQAMIEAEEKWMTNMDRYRYSISENSIKFYTDTIVPGMYVIQPTFVTGTEDNAAPELNTLMERYMAGQIKMEQFIKDADSKMMMMQMEDY